MNLSSFLIGLLVDTAYALPSNVWEMYYEPMGGSGTGRYFVIGFAVRAANFILILLSGGAVIAITWGGFGMISSAGNEEEKENAKKILRYALFGLLFALMSQAIIYMVMNMVLEIAGNNPIEIPGNP